MSDTYYLDLKCPWCKKLQVLVSYHDDFDNITVCENCDEKFKVVQTFKTVKAK